MFLTYGAAFPDGATEDLLLGVYRPRPGLPFTPFVRADGTRRLLWTTFTAEQVDVDVRHPATRAYLHAVLDRLAGAGVGRVRLDAVGYAVKTPGTSSFMTPETFAFIGEFTGWCRQRGFAVLVEVHGHYLRQVEVARAVDYVYDFALPPLVLHALTAADAAPLLAWLRIRPANAITVLVDAIHANSGGTSQRATGAAAANLDLYQVNCTFYDALGRDDDRYLLARALQFWVPGIPQVYYVGLLAGGNDMDLLGRTGVGRDINRHAYPAAEILSELGRPVVRSLLALIRFRNAHPAFGGHLSFAGHPSGLVLTWTDGDEVAELTADLTAGAGQVTWTENGARRSAALAALAALAPA
jgi:sucrose phosphorylase